MTQWKHWTILIRLSLAVFIIVIDTTIMNVLISVLIVDLDTSVGGVQKAIALFVMVMASFILIGGKLADIVGKKRTFLMGRYFWRWTTSLCAWRAVFSLIR